MTTNQTESERLAKECAKNLAMDSSHIPLIINEILKTIPLTQLIAVARAANKSNSRHTPQGTVDDDLIKELEIPQTIWP